MRKIEKKNIEDILALTPVQEGMLYYYLKDPVGELYLEQLCLSISGEIEDRLFEKAWNVVIDSNEMLRTAFLWEKMEKPVQIVLKKHDLKPIFYSANKRDLVKKQSSVDNWLEEVKTKEWKKKFDLRDVPFRVALCKIEDGKYEMIISNHHILYDGWSNGIILEEFFNTYNNQVTGKKLVKPGKTKFGKYVKWLQDQDHHIQKQYWLEYLSGFDTSSALTIKRRKTVELKGSGSSRAGWGEEAAEGLQEFARQHKITLAALLYGAWGILLQKYGNSEDVLFGTTVSGRPTRIPGIEKIVGMFINTLPLRVKTQPHETVLGMLSRINNAKQKREQYESTPLVRIREYIECSGSEELFDTIMVIENYPLARRLQEAEGSISPLDYTIRETTHYDLTVAVSTFGGLDVQFHYNTEVLGEEIVLQMSRHYLAVVGAMVHSSDSEPLRLEILSEEEKRQLIIDCNSPVGGYPFDKSIHQLFEEQVERTPHYIAITNGDQALTYRCLYEDTRYIAVYLQNRGVEKNRLLGILVDRSLEMITGILGILKNGCGYVPLNPKAPVERNAYMLDECAVDMLLTVRAMSQSAEKITSAKKIVYLDEIHHTLPTGQNPESIAPYRETGIAYVIFTSGSTGKPKGVPITHSNLSPLLHWGYKELGIGPKDRILQNVSYYFDWSVWELFITLTTGARLYTAPGELQQDPEACTAFIGKNKITALHATPTQWGYLVPQWNTHSREGKENAEQKSLRYIFIGGEKLNVHLLERIIAAVDKECRIFNMYGPTET
ncbi:MAG: AMP-binding protein, partial [bacterium]|nr:AMP-binding protein [bacterium]